MFELRIKYKDGSYVISYAERKALEPLHGYYHEKWNMSTLRFDNGLTGLIV